MKRFINSLFILCIWTSLFADETVLPVPHSVSILPHTGQMQYTINMCHLQDPDFDWNVNLTYSSDGFRPLVYSGVVGQNWSLAIGGCITREVVGLPDDGKYIGDPYPDLGFLELLKSKQSDLENLHTDEQFYNYASMLASYRDASSDIYSFSINGHSGRFIIGWDGKARCLSGDVVKADFSSVSTQFVDNQNGNSILSGLKVPLPSQITLTTTDGYQYVFGGDSTTLEYAYTFSHTTGDAINTSPDPVITAWYITRIIAPNKREMRYHYRQHAANQYSYTENGVGAFRADIGSQRLFNSLYTSFLLPNADPDLAGDEIDGVWHIIAEQSIAKNVILDSVTTSDNSFGIRLTYENDSNYIFTHSTPFFGTTMPAGLQLKQKKPFVQSVSVYSGSSTIAAWTLGYQEVRLGERHTPRQYLSSCTTTGNIGYLFTYDYSSSGTLSELDTLAHLDAYGYRNTSGHSKLGTLTQVRDILGGRTSIEYELSDFDSIRIFYEDGKSLLRPSSGITYNGICTKQILVKDNAEHVYLRKCYQYGNSPGNGILNIDFAFLRDSTYQTKKCYDLCGYLHTSPTGRTPLEYTKVEEVVYKENSSTPTKNIYYYNTTQDSIGGGYLHSAEEVKCVYGLVSQERRRSLPRRVEHINTSEQLTKKIDYIYSPIITEHYSTNSTELVCKIYHPQALLTQQTTCEYESNGSYSTQNQYTYDTLNRVVREDTYIGNEHQFIAYTYPDALFVTDTTRQDAYAKGLWVMCLQNRVNMPVETRQGYVKNNSDHLTAASVNLPKRYEFNTPGGDVPPPIGPGIEQGKRGGIVPNPPSPYTAPYATLQLRLTSPITDITPIHIVGGNVVADSRYDTIVKYEYDDMMRPLRIMPKGEPVTYFYWDNKSLNILRKTTGANIIRFTWSPYVGMQSQTDVRGVTTYYRYNSLGQLIETYRMKGNTKEVLQYYEYHYPVIE